MFESMHKYLYKMFYYSIRIVYNTNALQIIQFKNAILSAIAFITNVVKINTSAVFINMHLYILTIRFSEKYNLFNNFQDE